MIANDTDLPLSAPELVCLTAIRTNPRAMDAFPRLAQDSLSRSVAEYAAMPADHHQSILAALRAAQVIAETAEDRGATASVNVAEFAELYAKAWINARQEPRG